MLKRGEQLPLERETPEDVLRVHAAAYEFDGNIPSELRRFLHCEPHRSETATTEFADEPQAFCDRRIIDGAWLTVFRRYDGMLGCAERKPDARSARRRGRLGCMGRTRRVRCELRFRC